jgi:hypothetical protein
VPRRKTLREKWRAYTWSRESRTLAFDGRHPQLRWFPTFIAISFVAVTGVALGVNYMRPGAGLGGFLLSLVTIDFGMAAVAVLSWILGRKLWREEHDPRYLAAAIGFAALPVWGVLDSLCISFVMPALSLNDVCTAIPGAAWLAILVLIVVPLAAILIDFRWYLAEQRHEAAAVKRTGTPR